MKKNKSYIGISFIILIFGIYAIPKIVELRWAIPKLFVADKKMTVYNGMYSHQWTLKSGRRQQYRLIRYRTS